MRQYRFPENKITQIALGVFLFAMLLLARDTMFTTAVLGVNKSQFLMLGLIGIAGILFLIRNKKNLISILKDLRILFILAVTVLFLTPMFVKRDWQLMYFSMLLCVYFGVFLTYFLSLKEVARYYVVTMAVLGVYSVLATYLLRIPVDAGIFAVPTFFNSHEYLFHNFGLAIVSDSYVKIRNFGIFREPGVYQYFLLLALYLNNYTMSWKTSRQLWTVNGILAVTMLSTFATGGIIEMGLFVLVMFLDKKLYQNKRIVIVVAALAVAAVAVGVYSIATKNALYDTIYNMVAKLFTAHGSTEARLDAIRADTAIFLQHPVFGEKIATVMFSTDHNTTSTMLQYAIFGAIGGTVNVAAWVALVWEKERKVWVNLALLVILFMSFNTQNLITDVYFWLFPIMALVERGLPALNGWRKNR